MNSSRHPGKKTQPGKSAVPAQESKTVRMAVSRTHKPEGLDLEEWQRLLRTQYGEQQNFLLENQGDHPVFSEFAVTNPQSGRAYKVAIRGDKSGDNYCSCPDFEINNLGTCKHIAFTLARLKKDNGTKNVFTKAYAPPFSEVFLAYGLKKEVRIRLGPLLRRRDGLYPAILEQRIGRVHRLGQRRAVRVINFVSKTSIEERILDLLKFKKSLFSGALDEGGEDVVMIGESQLKQYIQTVEAATENLETTGLSYEAEERIEERRDTEVINRKEAEAEQDEFMIQGYRALGKAGNMACEGATMPAEAPDMAARNPAITSENTGTPSPEAKPIAPDKEAPAAALGRLIMQGAELLMGMGQALAKDGASPREAIERQMGAMMGRDETTGKPYLKVPLPEPEKIQDIFSAIGGLLAGVLAGNKRDG